MARPGATRPLDSFCPFCVFETEAVELYQWNSGLGQGVAE